MKAKEVLNTLRISRATLHNYLKEGKITATTINGRHNYDSKSVYTLINKQEKLNYIYSRVSTQKQKTDLNNQIEKLKSFCYAKGIQIGGVYKDIGSGISFEKRKDLMLMLRAVIDYKVSNIIISHKDRLSRIGFGMFKNLFANYGTEIIVMDDTLNEKTDTEEIFEDIVSLLHCYSMKFYSKRKAIKKALE
ncbi:MAG: IS607 family transposase [Thaumarchaeota archaeon]|nr:IS607 family transposase [Nitrososphaerota archaeon]